ncbi:lipoprotein Blc [alpha proteobacterium U9-1i]|nr:lipoprotein Blc [alpha proteobacterium U9-1i]
MRSLILTLAVLAGACAGQPVNRTSSTPLPVSAVETEPYLGLWHEAARLPNRFERDCVAATAEYGARDDGMLSVRNVCTRADGSTRDAVGRARRVGEGDEGKLKVSFFGPFWADYWVVERADDYSWSIVSEPEGRYLWVLTRAEQITPAERALFDARLRALGFDTSKLIWNAAS